MTKTNATKKATTTKTTFNSVTSYGSINAVNGDTEFSLKYFSELGFSSLSKNMKIHSKFSGLPNFTSGQKPLVKVQQTKSGQVALCVCGSGIYCHVKPLNSAEFSRKTIEVDTIKKFRTIKSLLGKLLRKKDLVTSNMLQTRVCNIPCKL